MTLRPTSVEKVYLEVSRYNCTITSVRHEQMYLDLYWFLCNLRKRTKQTLTRETKLQRRDRWESGIQDTNRVLEQKLAIDWKPWTQQNITVLGGEKKDYSEVFLWLIWCIFLDFLCVIWAEVRTFFKLFLLDLRAIFGADFRDCFSWILGLDFTGFTEFWGLFWSCFGGVFQQCFGCILAGILDCCLGCFEVI